MDFGGTLAETCKGRTDRRFHTEACCCQLRGTLSVSLPAERQGQDQASGLEVAV